MQIEKLVWPGEYSTDRKLTSKDFRPLKVLIGMQVTGG